MKRILVTGGAGFIGSHLCKTLLELNNEVICIDNFYSGSKENIEKLIDYEKFEFVKHDIISSLSLEVDEIYNLACPASPVSYQLDPVRTIKTCIYGSLNMLELAKNTDAKILQASTSEIYGNPLIHPQTEDYVGNVNPIGPRSCYDEGKRASETLFFDYFRQFNIDISVVRIFNTYGPNMSINDGRVVSNFICQALKNQNISIYGDGKQTRSFCFIDDLVSGLILMMGKKEFQGPVNLGNPDEISVVELAKDIISLTNSKSSIENKVLPEDDPIQRKPDISLAKKELNWSPKTNRIDGLKKTINYFNSLLI
mgnify:FL=1